MMSSGGVVGERTLRHRLFPYAGWAFVSTRQAAYDTNRREVALRALIENSPAFGIDGPLKSELIMIAVA